MAELRYNPLLDDWVMIASHRQNRPQMPNDWCPFCPGSGKVPNAYDVLKYDNDFPALTLTPPQPDDGSDDTLFLASPALGKCEVILYSPDHAITLPELPETHIEKIIRLWQDRFKELSKERAIKYVFIFENRGEAVGVTMPHPHGQIYGYSWIPLRIRQKLERAKAYYEKNGQSLFDDLLRKEIADERRIIFETERFAVFIPFHAEYPFGINIQIKDAKANITDFTKEDVSSFAKTLKYAAGALDALFDMPFPYMMCMYNAPSDGADAYEAYWRFHIEFFPPMRSKDKQKFNASSETGAWAPCNPVAPERAAEALREAFERFVKKNLSR